MWRVFTDGGTPRLRVPFRRFELASEPLKPKCLSFSLFVLSLLCKRDAGRICIECAIHLRRVRAFSSLIDVETFSQELLHGIANCSLVRIIRNTFRNTDGLIYRRDDGNGRNRRWKPSMREKFRSYFFFTAGHWSLFKRLVESDTDWYESKDMISDELTRFDPSGDTFIPLVD